jgi:drug/metabolite transporter (DMT)-like permease
VAALLALLASVAWGFADFLGGTLSRRVPTPVVMLWSQSAGLACCAVLLALGGWRTPGAYLWWGVGGSLFGTLAGACFYRGLALGTMSIVAPIAGTSLVVPVVAGLLEGERPGAVALAGIVLATVGVVLASGPELRAIGAQRRAVLLACLAAVGFGGALALMPRAGEGRWAMTSAVVTGVGLLMTALFVLVRRPARVPRTGRENGGILAVGALNVAALSLYSYASTLGLVAIVAVLASLYSVVTVLLAQVFHGERLRGVQLVGVVAAFAGVACLGAA